MQFQIGDKVRAIATERECGYGVTNSDNDWTGEVVDIDGDNILVNVVTYFGDKTTDWVTARYFEKIVGGGRHTKSKKKKLQYQF